MTGPPEDFTTKKLAGTRILIVEDELFIALDIEATLADAGAQILGPCAELADALKAAVSENISLATLDLRLGRESTEPVASALARRGIPFIFYSGQSLPANMRRRWPDAIIITKPARPRTLVDEVVSTLRAAAAAP
jgi:DNA-binding response OmpR family regulator